MAPIWRLACVRAKVVASDDPLVKVKRHVSDNLGRKKTRLPRFP